MTVYRKAMVVAVIGLVLGGCASSPDSPAPVEDSDERSQAPPSTSGTDAGEGPSQSRETNRGWRLSEPAPPSDEPATDTGSSPAVVSLTRKAGRLYDGGEYRRAIATAERALRIDRRHAELYLVLARSYWQLAQPDQSEQFARQGLRYVASGQAIAEALKAVLAQGR